MAPTVARYEQNVFVNCPFDDEFRPVMRAIVFAVHDCGFVARCSQETVDGGDVRINRIRRLIKESRFGIHDISRTELDAVHQLPRFNMPLELGLFLGAKEFGDKDQRAKVTLVLDRERYRYQRYCSDIAGQDIEQHGDDESQAISVVRNWLASHVKRRLPGGPVMAGRHSKFKEQLPAICQGADLDAHTLTFIDFRSLVVEWLKADRRVLVSRPEAS